MYLIVDKGMEGLEWVTQVVYESRGRGRGERG